MKKDMSYVVWQEGEWFISQCLAGRIPMSEVEGVPESVRDLRAQSSEVCHELARKRGAGEASGNRNHERFIRDCVAGRDRGDFRTGPDISRFPVTDFH